MNKLIFLLLIIVTEQVNAAGHLCTINGTTVYRYGPCPEEGSSEYIDADEKLKVGNQNAQDKQSQQIKAKECSELERIALLGGPHVDTEISQVGSAKQQMLNAMRLYQSSCGQITLSASHCSNLKRDAMNFGSNGTIGEGWSTKQRAQHALQIFQLGCRAN